MKDAAKRAFPDRDPDDFHIRVEDGQLIMWYFVEGGVGNIQHFAEDGYEKAKKSPYDWEKNTEENRRKR